MLGLLILSFPTLLVTLLAFLVDILLFIPHLQWGGWIVLAAVILITSSSILTCAMRRTLVSRKARKKRIAENPDMNGENFYHPSQNTKVMQETPPTPISQNTQFQNVAFARAESPPPLDGMKNGKPQFAAYDTANSRPSTTDDRIPLNPRNPSIKTTSSNGRRAGVPGPRSDPRRPPPPINTVGPYHGEGRRSPVSPLEYEGGPPPHVGRGPPESGHGFHGGLPPRGRGGPPPFYGRGRGGYPPRGGYGPPPRGGFGPRGGPPPMRGGPPPRGGFFRGGYPSRGGPPPAWDRNMGPAAAGAGVGVAAGAMMGRGSRRPPPGYENDYYDEAHRRNPYYAQHADQQPYDEHGNPGSYDDRSRVPLESGYDSAGAYGAGGHVEQRPIGSSGRPSPSATPRPEFSRQGSQGRDAASYGFMGPSPSVSRSGSRPREPAHEPASAPPMPPFSKGNLPIGQAVEMDASSGSPARSLVQPVSPNVITPGGHESSYTAFPYSSHDSQSPVGNAPVELGESSPRPHRAQPAELPSPEQQVAPGTAVSGSSGTYFKEPSQARPSHDNSDYYEDVDPRFAQQNVSHNPPKLQQPSVPSMLMPGYHNHNSGGAISRDNSSGSFYSYHPVEDPTGRVRSPGAASDNSNFTSISQRGVNPHWRHSPGPPSVHGSDVGSRTRTVKRDDTRVLETNPDFAIAGVPPPGHNRNKSSGGAATGRPRGLSGGGMQSGPYPGM